MVLLLRICFLFLFAWHNCFEKKYAARIEEVLRYTTILDIWDAKWLWGGWEAMNRNWYVKHRAFDQGNGNCFGGDPA